MRTASGGWGAGVLLVAAVLLARCGVATRDVVELPPNPPPRLGVIAQGSDVATVAAAVHEVGGIVTRELRIIHAVAADVTPEQGRALARHSAVKHVWQDRAVHAQSPGAGR